MLPCFIRTVHRKNSKYKNRSFSWPVFGRRDDLLSFYFIDEAQDAQIINTVHTFKCSYVMYSLNAKNLKYFSLLYQFFMCSKTRIHIMFQINLKDSFTFVSFRIVPLYTEHRPYVQLLEKLLWSIQWNNWTLHQMMARCTSFLIYFKVIYLCPTS
jgi:hypothetical protein